MLYVKPIESTTQSWGISESLAAVLVLHVLVVSGREEQAETKATMGVMVYLLVGRRR